jgi:hypothetical protein
MEGCMEGCMGGCIEGRIKDDRAKTPKPPGLRPKARNWPNSHTCAEPCERVLFAPLVRPTGRISVPELCPALARLYLRAG